MPERSQITFSKEIAPIILQNCAPCHRPGQSAPFSLLTFQDVKKHAADITNVIARGYMPPWLPQHSYGDFVGERRLSTNEIQLIEQWVAQGANEGNPAELPPAPKLPSDWPLAKPDLVVTFSEPYQFRAEGPDIYRNFVIPLGLKERRYVRAVDVRPGTPAVHHALLAFDRTGTARRWDARDVEPGFAAFTLPSELEMPAYFLGWHPGKQASEVPHGLAWTLEAATDLVLQLHLRSTGKPETVAPRVAFYFTSEPPTNQPLKLILSSLKISLPPGASNEVVRNKFPLMGDSDLLAVAPHAHFLAKRITARAQFPDGAGQVLLHISEWDFNWQDSYQYKQPVFLPAGTVLEMEIAYDNSAANPRNPHSPPEHVRYGLESSDEMAVIGFQLLPRNRVSAERLAASLRDDLIRYNIEFNTILVERDANNVRARVSLARALYISGQLEAATSHLAIARKVDSSDDDAALLDAMVWRARQRPAEARTAFEDCLRLNPNHYRAHGAFAVLAIEQGWLDVAEFHLRETLRLDPNDTEARDMLRRVQQRRSSQP